MMKKLPMSAVPAKQRSLQSTYYSSGNVLGGGYQGGTVSQFPDAGLPKRFRLQGPGALRYGRARMQLRA